ncbi:MAG TPA: ribonuclease P protein component, partial [Steroidobacteraceae bacterium]
VMKSAVARNRIRRCVREVFRQRRPDLAPADYLITLMRPYCETALDDARAELGRLLSQAAK